MLAVPLRSSPATVSTPGMVAGRPDLDVASPAVARGGDDHDVLLLGVQEGRVPALRPFRRRAAEGDVDDAGPVVDGPADGLGDLVLVALAAGVRGSEPRGDGQQLRFGGHPDNSVRGDARGSALGLGLAR